ncbi:MAG: ABC transporter permease [Vicinamibacteria bacterium]|nr:ABC transporter permease [Vicinamibacteria bacterium]
MIRHLFKLIWNRKRANALVISEIFVCFLVLFAVLTQILYNVSNYRKPLGFAYANVSGLNLRLQDNEGGRQTSLTGSAAMSEPVAENPYQDRQRALLQVVKADPAVEDAAWAAPLPMSHSNETRSLMFRKHRVRYSMARCTDEYKDVMGIEITRGRWFSPEDDGGGYEAMVITEALARLAFGDEDPVGKSFTADRSESGEPLPEKRVVGVMGAFRQEGEMDAQDVYALSRLEYSGRPMSSIDGMALRLKPGSDASVEARITASLLAAAPDFSFRMEPLEAAAEFNRRAFMAPIALFGVVALFLTFMVALGLSGVLWQSVTSRIREIGVRRAMGASAQDVRWQVIGELLVMSTIAILAGVVVVLQFPFLDLLGAMSRGVFVAGLSLTIVSLYGLALVCALHPARLATTVHPAEALRYE